MPKTITVTYLNNTETKPVRLKASCEGYSAIVGRWDYETTEQACEAALIELCRKMDLGGQFVKGVLKSKIWVYVLVPECAQDGDFVNVTAQPLFEIREGNGNDGEFKRGHIRAADAFEALRKASHSGMICKPRDVKLSDFDGDDQYASAASYVAPIFGDCCRWTASARLVTEVTE